MSTHGIEQQEVIERYLRGELSADERRAFQDHFFSCDECVEQMQTMHRFIAGVRFAAESGSLRPVEVPRSGTEAKSPWVGWLRPAFAFASIAVLALSAIAGWLVLYRLPHLRAEITNERQMREQVARDYNENLNHILDALERERQQRRDLENMRAGSKAPDKAPAADVVAVNVPYVMLESTRSGSTSELPIPPGTENVLLLAAVEPGNRFAAYRLEVHNAEGQVVVKTPRALKPNSDGVVNAQLSARVFQSGKYMVRLYGVSGQHETLVGEYALHVRRP